MLKILIKWDSHNNERRLVNGYGIIALAVQPKSLAML